MDIIKISLTTSFFIIFIIILRAIAMHYIPKKIFMLLWDIAIIQLIIPFRIPSQLKIYSIMNNIFNNVISGISYSDKINEDIIVVKNNITYDMFSIPAKENKPSIWFIIWIIGICILLAYFIISLVKSSRRLQLAIPISDNDYIKKWINENKIKRKIKVSSLDRITSPVTYGIFRPKIILPKILDYSNEKQLEYILTHELMHIKRFDVALKLIVIIVACIYWFNPLVWIMYILVNRDIEISCDEKVISIYGENFKSDYALSLINMVETKANFSYVYSCFGKNAIRERIVMVMNYKRISNLSIGVIVILLLSFTSIFAMTNAKEKSRGTSKYLYFDDYKDIGVTVDDSQVEILDDNDENNIYKIDFNDNTNSEAIESDIIYDGSQYFYITDYEKTSEKSSIPTDEHTHNYSQSTEINIISDTLD